MPMRYPSAQFDIGQGSSETRCAWRLWQAAPSSRAASDAELGDGLRGGCIVASVPPTTGGGVSGEDVASGGLDL